MTNHLNFFVPYESATSWHENQLTRALLVVLRYSPIAHQAWLHLVAPERSLQTLPKAEFATQRQRIMTGPPGAEGDAIPGISVWLAPDAERVRASVEASDRQQVLDAIISYGSDLVIVVENKISWRGPTEQAHRINLHGAPVKFDEQPRSVQWQHLLEILADLVERDLVHGAERLLIGDFLDLVDDYFPHIGPYSTLGRCGSHAFRLERRLDVVQGVVVGIDKGKGTGWRDIAGTPKIFMAWLGFIGDDSTVRLRMYPADTLGQARAFYGDPESVDLVLALRSEGWRVEPNFHWGFMAGGYAWSDTRLPADEYCAYWVERIAGTRELPRTDWDSYWTKLEADGIVEPTAKAAFDREFTASQRQKAHPRPGIFCEFSWPLPEAAQMDDRGTFTETIRARMNQLLGALGAPEVRARGA
ncbi:hypothetical protein H5368_01245 [Luteimonas sp. MC1782]|uniref:hypothetical protein n=1 Tax=Luteimonas sp. MC1782 TaxID=2760305 RepID=UPI0016021AE9|nr:hypothetical protein [Luteimonas sp. MC1782]MBB1471650.1 hypothetical protein [Luteimonas sp. MC1782]